MKPIAVPVRDFCQLTGVGRSTAFALIRASEVDVVKLGRKTLITYESAERLIARNTVKGRD